MEQVLNIFSQYKNPDGLLKSISHSFVFRVLGLLLIYVSQVLLARLMGPKAYGDYTCLLYTSDAADERSSVDLGGRRIIKKKKRKKLRVQRRYSKQKHTM